MAAGAPSQKGEAKSEKARRFFENADAYLQNRYVMEIRAQVIRELLDGFPYDRVLDLGCGDGSLSLQLLRPGLELTLVDVSQAMLDACRNATPPEHAARVHTIRRTVEEFEPQGEFDVVLCIGVLPHLHDPAKGIRRVASALRSGGRCIVHITDFDRPIGKLIFGYAQMRERLLGDYGYAFVRLGSKKIAEIAAHEGLELLDARRYWCPLPGMRRFLSQDLLLRYERFTLERRFLSEMGSDSVLCFAKR